MVGFSSGLIVTPALMQRNVSVTMDFEPSIGIMARRFDKLGLDIRSFKEPLSRAIKQVVIPSIRTNFDVGGRPAWSSLAERTVKTKGNNKKLVTSGALRRQMGYFKLWDVDRETAKLTNLPTSVWYGKLHQEGYGTVDMQEEFHFPQGHRGPAVSLGMRNYGEGNGAPARPFVMLQDEDLPKIDEVFSEWLQERIVKAGLG